MSLIDRCNVVWSTHRRWVPTGADDRETLLRSRRFQGWENVVANLRQTELQDLIAYLEKCARNGEGAELPQEWACQLLLALNASRDIVSSGEAPNLSARGGSSGESEIAPRLSR